jgi:Short C-terminal domain
VRERADLHRSGVLTDDEFSAAKAKILDLDDDVT